MCKSREVIFILRTQVKKNITPDYNLIEKPEKRLHSAITSYKVFHLFLLSARNFRVMTPKQKTSSGVSNWFQFILTSNIQFDFSQYTYFIIYLV